jgi:hypothetical protein
MANVFLANIALKGKTTALKVARLTNTNSSNMHLRHLEMIYTYPRVLSPSWSDMFAFFTSINNAG